MFYAARCLSSIIYNKNWKPKGHNIGERLNKVLPFRMTCYSTFRIIISYIMKMVNKHILRLREKLEIIRFSLSISVFCTSAVNASSHPFHLDRETHLARDVQRLCRSLSTPTRPGPAEAVGPRARWVGQAPRSPFSAARPAADPRRRPLRPPHFLAHTEERHRLPGALRASEDRSGCTPLTRQD